MRTAESAKIIATALSLVALLAGGACKSGSNADVKLPPAKGEGAPPLPALPTIEKGDDATAVSATEGQTTGTTFPRAEAQVGVNATGVITKILVKEGDRVRRGQLLFRQDARDAALRVQQARAAREAAAVNLRAAETEHQRMKVMFEQKAVNQMQWDQAVTRLDGARVAVQQADVALSMAQKAQADATVRSPIDGLITAKLKSEGEMATMMPPTVVLVVQDQSALELRFRLPERSMSQVKAGDVVKARFDAIGATRDAKVLRVQPSVDARTRTVEVIAEIPNKDGALKSGLLAAVQIRGATQAPKAEAAGR